MASSKLTERYQCERRLFMFQLSKRQDQLVTPCTSQVHVYQSWASFGQSCPIRRSVFDRCHGSSLDIFFRGSAQVVTTNHQFREEILLLLTGYHPDSVSGDPPRLTDYRCANLMFKSISISLRCAFGKQTLPKCRRYAAEGGHQKSSTINPVPFSFAISSNSRAMTRSMIPNPTHLKITFPSTFNGSLS